ncbi:DUF6261 family protein [Draconibacterium sediminis]|uniref:Uncharacterized protein n=1 Tax=Draconibacterium sediminis TaxID=1544798 RepID=A0A0D8J6Z1_9BACT|nr:DUF6261 family protein [Draconibacterium sediminis]KJF42266.1 hypothetical protein LH29_20965 [Draconibacterium sediminis]
MTKIKNVVFSRFRNNDHYQFITEFKTRIDTVTPAILNIETKMPDFNTAYDAMDTVYKKSNSSDFTPLIGGADVRRDRYWSAIYMRLRSTLMGPIESEVEAAEKLKALFDLHGNVRQMPLKGESAALTNLIQDLESRDFGGYCNTVGILPWIEALKTENLLVQNLMEERRQESVNQNSEDYKLLRKAVDIAYENIVSRINALVELEMSTPEIENFIELTNNQITDYENELTARQGRLDSEQEEEEPITPAPDVEA